MLLVIRYLTGKQLSKPYFLLLLGSLLWASSSSAQCLSMVRSGNVTTTSSRFGYIDIRNPERVKAADESYATATSLVSIGLGNEIPSEELEVKDFRFSIPETAVICGVEVRVKRRVSTVVGVSIGSAGPKDRQVILLKNGNKVGANKATGALWGTDDGYTRYGGRDGKWSAALTPADVNNSNFGVSLALNFTA